MNTIEIETKFFILSLFRENLNVRLFRRSIGVICTGGELAPYIIILQLCKQVRLDSINDIRYTG